jgi:hypothetical protein
MGGDEGFGNHVANLLDQTCRIGDRFPVSITDRAASARYGPGRVHSRSSRLVAQVSRLRSSGEQVAHPDIGCAADNHRVRDVADRPRRRNRCEGACQPVVRRTREAGDAVGISDRAGGVRRGTARRGHREPDPHAGDTLAAGGQLGRYVQVDLRRRKLGVTGRSGLRAVVDGDG